MEPDILLKLQKLDGYKEGRVVAIPMCSVCKFRISTGCEVYGYCPNSILYEYKYCDKAVLDKNSFSYPRYMELYGYRHKSEE